MPQRTPGEDAQNRLARLPAGRHGLPPEFVAANHRDRLMTACVQEVDKHGYVEMTVADIIATAAVSRRTFYEFFDSKEACFLATFDIVFGHLGKVVTEAYESKDAWVEQVGAGLGAFLEFLADEPRLAKFCLVEPITSGPLVSRHLRDGIAGFAVLLDRGREQPGAERPAEGTAEAVIAGMVSLIVQRIIAGEAESLEELLPDLLESCLVPYLGPVEAERLARE